MKSSMKDEVKGMFYEAKGKVKEMAGEITDNSKLEAKGKAEKIAGKVQEKIGQLKKVLANWSHRNDRSNRQSTISRETQEMRHNQRVQRSPNKASFGDQQYWASGEEYAFF